MTRVSKYRCELADIENLISIHIQNSATIPNEIVKLTEIQTLIVNEFERFQIKHEELCQFLEREHTTDSLRELETQHKDMQTVSIRVDRVLQKVKDTIDLVNTKSHSGSSKHSGSQFTSHSRRSLQKAEAAKVKLKMAEQAAELKRQKLKLEFEEKLRIAETERHKADLDVEIDLLKSKEEHETAKAEYEVLVQTEDNVKKELCENPTMYLPSTTTEEKTSNYVAGLSGSVSQNQKLNPNAQPFHRQVDDAQQPPHQTGQHFLHHTDNSQHFPYQQDNVQHTFVHQPHFQMGVYPPYIQPPQGHHVPEMIPGFAPRNNNFVQGTDVERNL